MPAPEILNLMDYAVLWTANRIGAYGRYTVSAAVEVRVRWEDISEESGDPQNTVVASPVTIFVDRAMDVGSILWHGRQRDLPDVPTDLLKVVGSSYTPDIRGRVNQRTVTLVRYSDALPTVEA